MAKFDLIKLLQSRPGQTASSYAKQMDQTTSTLNLMLSNLEQKKLVRRELQNSKEMHNSSSNQYIWYMIVKAI